MIASARLVAHRLVFGVVAVTGAMVPAGGWHRASAQTPKEIVDRVDRMLRGNSSQGQVTMDVVTPHYSRSITMRIWSLGTKYTLVRVTAPPKDAGTATLKVGNDLWNYLPHVDRTIRLPASLMGASWMGSDFTNDDLVKESRIVDDYDIAISFNGVRGGHKVWEFTLTPKPDAAVVWGRIVEEIRQDDLMPDWGRYYDDRGALVRTMTFSDFTVMGGRLVPATMEVRPADKADQHTVLHYQSLRFDIDLTPAFFSLQQLRKAP
jgi:Outer membrane lipoprotein-sorting protein